MRRLPQTALAGAVAIALLAGIVVLGTGDGPFAYKVAGRAVSQRTLDDELEALHGNTDISSAISGAQVVPGADGSVSTQVSAAWVQLRILSSVAERVVDREGGHVTAADRTSSGVKRSAGFKDLPKDFGKELVERVAVVRAMQRMVESHSAAVADALASVCPSSRYVSHILVADLATAQSLKAQLDAGGDFAKLVAANSTDTSSAEQGGAVGCSDGQSFVAAFQEVASTQPVGVVSDPVQTQFGYHLILVNDQPSESDVSAAALSVLLGIVQRTHVEVDPRYGTWDRTNVRIVPPVVPGAVG